MSTAKAAAATEHLKIGDVLLAAAPIVPSLGLLLLLADANKQSSVTFFVLCVAGLGCFAFLLTSYLVPHIAEFTLAKRLSGKDLGKKGTARESVDVPEALGIVPGTVFLICAIVSQSILARSTDELVIWNSATLSICFMLFLGFTDDVLDLKWRYKLILPTVATLPLLCTYTGFTAVLVPSALRWMLMSEGKLTILGYLVNIFFTVDQEADGAIIELGWYFMIYMGMLAVFCTNAINIYAGINGLEAGQTYVIGCSILAFKLYEIYRGDMGENQYFAINVLVPFIGATLGLLRHNWFPANVFVGDTFCYFAGMTFAVVGIHGHLTKTLLLLFLPQVLNFIYSIPQLFKLIPCPRHRLPRVNVETGLLEYSRFACKPDEYKLFKVRRNDEEVPNCTVICLALRIFGPMRERTLCTVLLVFQVLCSLLAFYVRYVLLEGERLRIFVQ